MIEKLLTTGIKGMEDDEIFAKTYFKLNESIDLLNTLEERVKKLEEQV